METNEKEFKPFNVDIWKYDGHAGALIPLLQSAQDTYGYVSERAIDYISHVTGFRLRKSMVWSPFMLNFEQSRLVKKLSRCVTVPPATSMALRKLPIP